MVILLVLFFLKDYVFRHKVDFGYLTDVTTVHVVLVLVLG